MLTIFRGLLFSGAGLAGFLVTDRILRHRRRENFRDKVVIITGGSRGLGLLLARRFARERAHLVLLARNAEELNRAEADLVEFRTLVLTYACDITDEQRLRQVVGDVVDRFGRIDVLVNNAGTIQVGPVETMTMADFEESMNVHLWGHVKLTLMALPHIKKSTAGRIVNITSIGGKVPVPHLLPYCTSKFALTGFSEALRTELLKDGIMVTTVCPGLMRTGSHVNAHFKGEHRKEYTLFSLTNAFPLFSADGDCAADRIIDACRHGDAELVIHPVAMMGIWLHGLCPALVSDLLGFLNRFLPGPGGIGTDRRTGKQSVTRLSPSFLTSLADSATVRNNEV